jgi:hypothetical protein
MIIETTQKSHYEEFISKHFSFIPFQLLKEVERTVSAKIGSDDYNASRDNLSTYIFGSATRTTRKLTEKMIYPESFDFSFMALSHILSVNLKLDINRITQLAQQRTESDFLQELKDIALHTTTTIKKILKAYDEARLFKLLLSGEHGLMKDTADMMTTIENKIPDLDYLPKKPKSFRLIHDYCVRTMPKIGQENFDLCQREDILKIDGQKILPNMTIRVPKTHYDLVDIGEELGFCIGNGTYSKKVRSGECSIIAVFDSKGAKYGVQFTRYHILSAEGFGNKHCYSPPIDILNQLKEILTCPPSLPSDFLPIVDSKWVKGYKYNDKDLYLLLNDIVYIYFDVPSDVYDGLLASQAKGRYVNKIIKGGYNYERLCDVSLIEFVMP